MSTIANINVINHGGSSLLKESVYNTDDLTLVVTFLNGAKYLYTNIPHEVFSEFSTIESKGSYFSKNIKGKFDHKKIEEDGDQTSK